MKNSLACAVFSIVLLAGAASAAPRGTLPAGACSVVGTVLQGDGLQIDPVGTPDSLLVLIFDNSLTVKRWELQSKATAKGLIAAAPPGTPVCIVVVGSRVESRTFVDAAQALTFVDRIRVDSQYTDLELGMLAALAEIEKARVPRPLVAVLSDGRVDVPVKGAVSFRDVLAREFTARPDVRVLFVNVGGKGNYDGLPANVIVKSPGTWKDALGDASIGEAVTLSLEAPSPESQADTPADGASESTMDWVLASTVAALVVLGLVAAIAYGARRFRNRSSESEATVHEIEDFRVPAPLPAPVVIIDAAPARGGIGAPRRAVLGVGDRFTIGASPASDIHLESLIQDTVFEAQYDGGEELTLLRSRPVYAGEEDMVCINDSETRSAKLQVGPDDRIEVGGYRLKLIFTDEEHVRLFRRAPRTVTALRIPPRNPRSSGRLNG